MPHPTHVRAARAAAALRRRPDRAPARRSRLPNPLRHQQIIDTAREVFATRGFRGATTREIAAAAGVTEAVIFQHFADKSALYAAILEKKATDPSNERWFAALEASRDRGNDADTLTVLFEGIIEQHRADPAHMRLVMYASLEGHP